MTITGLENNYYLSGNDIWITVDGFDKDVQYIELSASNITTPKNIPLSVFRMYPSPDNVIQFNISAIVRALRPISDITVFNSIQLYKFDFEYKDIEGNGDKVTVQKYFIDGIRRDKRKDWYLNEGDALVVGEWLSWQGVEHPIAPQIIQNGEIVTTPPKTSHVLNLRDEYQILIFKNSLGGWQYYVFATWKESLKVKPGAKINLIANRFYQNSFRQKENNDEKTVEFFTGRTQNIAKPVFEDLVRSGEVYLYDGTEYLKKLEVLSNSASFESHSKTFEGSVEFGFDGEVEAFHVLCGLGCSFNDSFNKSFEIC